MTTNVYCKKHNVLASDSRWSFRAIDDKIQSTVAVAFVDNTGYDKIAFDGDTGYMFAGPGLVIDKWREWALSPNQSVIPRPAVEADFAICMTDLESGEILMEHGQKISDTNCRMAGTGAKPAYECWSVNEDAKRAVVSATKQDMLSGGDVKFLGGVGVKHNLDFSVPFRSIRDQFLVKGMVMYIASPQALIPLAQAAQNDPRIQDLVNRVKAEQMSAEAPSGFDPVIWTPADEARLDDALAKRTQRRMQK